MPTSLPLGVKDLRSRWWGGRSRSSVAGRVELAGALGALGSVERPGAHVRQPAGRRLEHREGPDVGVGTDLGVVAGGLLDHGPGADDAVDQPGVGSELGAVADHATTLQHRAGEQGDVGAEPDGGVDVGVRRDRAW